MIGTTIFAIIAFLFVIVFVIAIRRTKNNTDAHKIHKEPLYCIDGELMNTHQYAQHKQSKEEKI